MLGITMAQAKRVGYSEKFCFRNIISTRLKKQMSKTLQASYALGGATTYP